MENQKRPQSANVNNPDKTLHARCSDISGQKCDWQTSGRNEDEVLKNVEQHGREKHGIQQMDGQMRDKARNAIRSGSQSKIA